MVVFFTGCRYAVRRVSADIPADCGFGSVCLILTYGPSIRRSTFPFRKFLKNSPQKSVCGSKSYRWGCGGLPLDDRPKSNIFWRFDSPNGETIRRGMRDYRPKNPGDCVRSTLIVRIGFHGILALRKSISVFFRRKFGGDRTNRVRTRRNRAIGT